MLEKFTDPSLLNLPQNVRPMTPPTGGEPYPDNLFNNIGLGFLFGAVYGSTHHLIKGIYNSPKGQRLVGASQAMLLNAPRVTSRCAAWFGVLGLYDTLLYYRRGEKDDPCNIIMAATATGGFLKLRHGVRAASRSALIGGTSLALLEGIGILLERYPLDEASKKKYVAGSQGFPLKEPEATPFWF